MKQLAGLIIVVLAFGGAFGASVLVERVLRRNMSNFLRGIFTFVVGYLALQGLLLISLMTCGIFGGDCP